MDGFGSDGDEMYADVRAPPCPTCVQAERREATHIAPKYPAPLGTSNPKLSASCYGQFGGLAAIPHDRKTKKF